MIKVSIVIPAYNAEPCLLETLESALSQTYPAHEILVIDDGSKDRTEEIARSFGDRVRYIKQQNQGIAGARNTGIREATGDWIAFLDHDDLFLPEKIEREVAELEKNPELVVVYSAFTYFYSDGTTKLQPAFPARQLWPTLRYKTPILPSTSIIRRSALEEIGYFNPSPRVRMIDDWDLWFRLIQRYSAKAFQDVPESLTMYRWWENNASKNYLPLTANVLHLLDTLLLRDLSGLRKWMWRRRIEARIFYHLSISLRESGNARYWEYAVGSFLRWPFFGTVLPLRRYKVLLHMLLTRVKRFRPEFRYWWPERHYREGLS